MQIVLNGESYELHEGGTVDALLQALSIQGKRLAVEINQQIVPRSQHSERAIQEGDRVEIVMAIGGG